MLEVLVGCWLSDYALTSHTKDQAGESYVCFWWNFSIKITTALYLVMTGKTPSWNIKCCPEKIIIHSKWQYAEYSHTDKYVKYSFENHVQKLCLQKYNFIYVKHTSFEISCFYMHLISEEGLSQLHKGDSGRTSRYWNTFWPLSLSQLHLSTIISYFTWQSEFKVGSGVQWMEWKREIICYTLLNNAHVCVHLTFHKPRRPMQHQI